MSNRKGSSRGDTLSQEPGAKILQVFWRDQFAKAFFDHAKSVRRREHRAVNGVPGQSSDGFAKTAHLQHGDILDAVPFEQRPKGQVRDRTKARDADLFILQRTQIADIRAHDHGLSKVRRHGGDLDNIAAMNHVADHRRTRKSGKVGGPGEHRLNHRR